MRRISIGTFDLSLEDIFSIANVLSTGYLSSGEALEKFEELIANRHNHDYGIMVNSGQSALECALVLAKKKLKKDKLKVIIPATTYAATLWAIINTGNEPFFCDIGKDYNLDYSLLENNSLYDDADVLLAVDLYGKICLLSQSIKEKYFIIEDACEAVGNTKCGYGDVTCFSFYVSHIITTGSGGMICVNDKESEKFLRSYISHGRVYGGDFTKNKDKWVDRFLFDKVGVSCRSDNLSAALGLSQFKKLADNVKKRKFNAKYLIDHFDFLSKYFVYPQSKDCVFQFFPILIKGNIDRAKLFNFLFEEGIDSRVLLSLTNQPVVKEMYGKIEDLFPFSKEVNSRGFIIGCHQNLTIEDLDYIIDSLERFIKKYEKDIIIE